jgi:YgiT-type zinc finger domain-containing protein
MNNSSDRTTIPCSECQAGQMHRNYVTYFTWLGDELITVPDFPAWVCDVCGRREYDPYALNQLNLLLNPGAGKSSQQAQNCSMSRIKAAPAGAANSLSYSV